MLAIALSILTGALLIAFTLRKGHSRMTAALDRLTASVDALVTQVATTDTELAAIADAIRNRAPPVGDDSDALNALADRIDAARGDLSAAATAAGDVVPPTETPPETPPAA